MAGRQGGPLTGTATQAVEGYAAQVEVPGVSSAGFSAVLPTGRARDLIDGTWVTCLTIGEPLLLVCAETLPASPSESHLESIRLQAGYLLGMGDVSASDHPSVLLIQACRKPVACALTVRPHGHFIPEFSAAALAVACSIPDSVAYEYCPLPPLLVSKPIALSNCEAMLPDWRLTVFIRLSHASDFAMSVQVTQCYPSLRLHVTVNDG